MNLKTTILLILLVGSGACAWIWFSRQKPEEPQSATATFLAKSLAAEKITRIEATRGEETRFVLEKVGNEWRLPGKWPARSQEAEQWLATLTSLRSRFAPTPLAKDADLGPFGLDDKPLTVKVTLGDITHTLRFGEEPGESNRFTRPTYVRLDDQPEVVRLGPGVIASLDRKIDYFRQLRLFPFERVPKNDEGKEKVEQLKASAVDVETPMSRFSIVKKGDDWVLKDAKKKGEKGWEQVTSEDRIDPARRDALLRGFPDIWADKFVSDRKSLDECGLKDPAFILTVTTLDNAKLRLHVGKVSDSKTRLGSKPPPPNPFAPPPKPPEIIVEEYRFAKLESNDQIFEIKADKLADISPAIDALRDSQLARFKTDDVKRLEIRHGEQVLLFAKIMDDAKKETWRLEKPRQEELDSRQVDEFLEKLTGLRARDEDVIDSADPKDFGLDKPAGTVSVTVEEKKGNAKTLREINFRIGIKPKEDAKAYVKVDHWPRVNKVDVDIWKLAQRSEVAYRVREVWKFDRDAITRITIEADGKPYHLDRDGKTWKITGPLEIATTGTEPETLAEDLTVLRAERFEGRDTKDLGKYGLDKPAFKVTVSAKDQKPRTLEIGKKDESTKEGGRFARVAGGDAVFVLSEKIAANLHADPFDFLDKNLADFSPEDIERIEYKNTASFTLERKKGEWQLTGTPFPLPSLDKQVLEGILKPWQKLRADKFSAAGTKIAWEKYGLDKPTATVTLTISKGDADKPKQFLVELGAESKDGGRYARFDKKDAVVVLPVALADQLSRTFLDFVDTRVIRPFDPDAVAVIDRKMAGNDIELVRREDAWQISKPLLREADNLTLFDVLRRTSGLQAKRIVAYAAKDLKDFGLDQPAAVVTLTLDPDGTPRRHVIKVGNLTSDKSRGEKDERYAMVDDKPMVVVLPAELSRSLVAPILFFADRNLADFSNVDRAEWTAGPRKLTFARTEAWQLVDPTKADADTPALDDLVRSLQRLRADEIVADKGADLKKYGLDMPAAQWRLKLGEEEKIHLLVGSPESAEPNARRYAKLGGKNAIFLLNAKLSSRVLGEFRSKKVWPGFEVAKVDEITITGPEGAFSLKRKDKEWTVVGQPKAMVKATVLDDTLSMLSTLTAQRFIADAKADLKAYGLEKPAWKLEVTTSAGKRELWLGAMEEKTKRPYATVAGSGAVFVIDEIDNIVLARPLSAYVEAEKKK